MIKPALPTPKPPPFKLDKILAKWIRGYAHKKYPMPGYPDAQAYREAHKKKLEQDASDMDRDDFIKKYGQYMA